MLRYTTYGPPMHDSLGAYGLLPGLFMFLICALIVLLVFRLARHGGHGHWHGLESRSSALDILSERYAKGELTKAEYESMKKDIAK